MNIRNDLPRYVKGDPTRLRQVIINLLNNAVKFTDKGEIAIEVGLKNEKNSVYKIFFNIRDEGIGIAQKDFDALFKSFSRIPQARNKAISGLGLGLAFVHTVITRHGGTITLESQEGQGTCFYIELPILFDEDEDKDISVVTDIGPTAE